MEPYPRSVRIEGPMYVAGKLHRSFAAKNAAQDDKRGLDD
jgi:hypothetical protein